MKVNLNPLTGPKREDSLSFSGELDLSSVSYWGNNPFKQPVKVTGTVKYLEYGRYQVDYTADYVVEVPCARCLADIKDKQAGTFTHKLQETDEDPLTEDTFIPINDGVLDVRHMVSTDLLLSMDDVTLCSPDCKGICPICGNDRNKKDCGCSVKMPDPRFDKLRELLDKSSK